MSVRVTIGFKGRLHHTIERIQLTPRGFIITSNPARIYYGVDPVRCGVRVGARIRARFSISVSVGVWVRVWVRVRVQISKPSLILNITPTLNLAPILS